MDRGWIKLHRKLLDSSFFNNPIISHYWIWCLLKSTHAAYDHQVGHQLVHLEPGQFIFGRKQASIETGLSEQNIRSTNKYLVETKNLTIKSTNKYSVISICNWTTYQTSFSENNQQLNHQSTNKTSKINHKQEHIQEQYNKEYKLDAKHVFEYFVLKTGRKIHASEQRMKIIEKRLETSTVDECKIAIDNFCNDDWPDRYKYTDIVYALGMRNKVDNFERWFNMKKANNTTAELI